MGEIGKMQSESHEEVENSKREKQTKMEVEVVINRQNRKIITCVPIILSIMMVVFSMLQWSTLHRQKEAAENANKLAIYKYRYEFYTKLEEIQEEVFVIEKNPQKEIEEMKEISFNILSLSRESTLLFDEETSSEVNKILNRHLEFLVKLNNDGMYYDDYAEEMKKLNDEYGEFLNSESFKKYIDINLIQ